MTERAATDVDVRSLPPVLPLFDPNTEPGPPHGILELYLEVPLSVDLYYRLGEQNGDQRIIDAIDTAREAGVAAALKALDRHGRDLRVGHHVKLDNSWRTSGLFLTGQLYLTRVAHTRVLPSVEPAQGKTDEFPRLHDHLYIGLLGLVHPSQGHWGVGTRMIRWPVVMDRPDHPAVLIMQAQFDQALKRSLTASLGVQWELDRRGGQRELAWPAFGPLVPQLTRVLCRGLPKQGPSAAQLLEELVAPQAAELIAEELESKPGGLWPERRQELHDIVKARYPMYHDQLWVLADEVLPWRERQPRVEAQVWAGPVEQPPRRLRPSQIRAQG